MSILTDIADDFEAYALLDFGETHTHIPDPQTDDDTVEFTAIHTAQAGNIENAPAGLNHQEKSTIQFLASDLTPSTITPRSRITRASDSTVYSPVGTPDNTHGVCTLRLMRVTRKTFGKS